MLVRKKLNRGQTSLETSFVFTMLIFMAFAIMNFAILFHTKNIATYAAFMAGRSYQVYGDTTGKDYFAEIGPNGKLISDVPVVPAIQVAEDIFTCSLPWVDVPSGDGNDNITIEEKLKDPLTRCQAGKRKYKNLNIGKTLKFRPFQQNFQAQASGKQDLDEVKGGFSEQGRKPLRYGILNLKYRAPIMFNPMGVFGDTEWVKSDVFVPVLLNPGLSTGLTNTKTNDKDFDNE